MIDFNSVAAKGVLRIAMRAADAEMRHARALGHGWFECYQLSYRCLDEILDLAREPMPALVLTRFRP